MHTVTVYGFGDEVEECGSEGRRRAIWERVRVHDRALPDVGIAAYYKNTRCVAMAWRLRIGLEASGRARAGRSEPVQNNGVDGVGRVPGGLALDAYNNEKLKMDESRPSAQLYDTLETREELKTHGVCSLRSSHAGERCSEAVKLEQAERIPDECSMRPQGAAGQRKALRKVGVVDGNEISGLGRREREVEAGGAGGRDGGMAVKDERTVSDQKDRLGTAQARPDDDGKPPEAEVDVHDVSQIRLSGTFRKVYDYRWSRAPMLMSVHRKQGRIATTSSRGAHDDTEEREREMLYQWSSLDLDRDPYRTNGTITNWIASENSIVRSTKAPYQIASEVLFDRSIPDIAWNGSTPKILAKFIQCDAHKSLKAIQCKNPPVDAGAAGAKALRFAVGPEARGSGGQSKDCANEADDLRDSEPSWWRSGRTKARGCQLSKIGYRVGKFFFRPSGTPPPLLTISGSDFSR
ncbi:hypothetical protein C8F01DRAFT_1076918 [Mycena amicta]|nr:hypothetical protein C8F01DRAFT_1076918 [Mycena amicta]